MACGVIFLLSILTKPWLSSRLKSVSIERLASNKGLIDLGRKLGNSYASLCSSPNCVGLVNRNTKLNLH